MKKHLSLVSIILFASFVLSACGSGQLLKPTFTPAPTLTPLPTFTPAPTFTPVPSLTPTPEPISIEEMNASVAKIVSDGTIQEYARCNLDAAVWGNYDMKVTVASDSTKDTSAHFFVINNGIFSEGLASTNPNSPATTEGRGIVKIDNQESAFDLGVPFFISDVTYDGKSVLNFTVVSNPKTTVEFASMGIETISETSWSVTIKPFTPSPESQKLTFDLGDRVPEKDMYLSILKQISGTYSFCLLSNQVDLSSLTSH